MTVQMQIASAFPALSLLAALVLAGGCRSQPEASRPPAPELPPAAVNEPQPAPFVVTKEVYSRTFEEVERFVVNLTQIIQRRDYDTWVTYLSAEYIRRISDPQYLQQQSEQPLLKQNNIRLNTLRDYFEHVVVPSRAAATIDDIEFIDENHVKAITAVRNTRAVLYLLVREDGGWKIGVW
jgi:hypothetical protein